MRTQAAKTVADDLSEGGISMKLSARNQLVGTVVAVKEGAVEAQVKIDIGAGQRVTSVITMDALADLGIEVGDQVIAIIKADAVMLGK